MNKILYKYHLSPIKIKLSISFFLRKCIRAFIGSVILYGTGGFCLEVTQAP